MQNTIKLHDSQDFYEVTHLGKSYRCSRVSDIIKNTQPTPFALKKWMVNCGVEKVFELFTTLDLHDGDYKRFKASAWSAHQIKSQQALDIGTKVHKWINNGAMVEAEACEESKACWGAYIKFVGEYVPAPIATEIALYDIKNLFAGTCDYIGLLGAIKGNSAKKKPIYLLDWKTSKSINNNYKIQVIVYRHMILSLLKEFIKYPSRFNESITRILNDLILVAGKNPQIVCGIVRLPKRPSTRKAFEFVTVTKQEEKAYLKEFVLMAKLHNLRTAKENKDGNTNGR